MSCRKGANVEITYSGEFVGSKSCLLPSNNRLSGTVLNKQVIYFISLPLAFVERHISGTSLSIGTYTYDFYYHNKLYIEMSTVPGFDMINCCVLIITHHAVSNILISWHATNDLFAIGNFLNVRTNADVHRGFINYL